METGDILKQFENLELLGTGGQKAVYHVRHPEYGDVALKIGQTTSPSSLLRIEREVGILNDIESPYYPAQYEFNTYSENRFSIIEEYVESVPLSGCLDEYSDITKALVLLWEIVIGLDVLWKKRIVHRDIKPGNILIKNSGKPVIIDLGIARALDMESLTHTLAMRGPGTRQYASPEQFMNRKADIDHRTDQFILGIVFLQLLLNGNHPFSPRLVGGDAIHVNILENNWWRDALDQIENHRIRELITKLLGYEPYQRYRTPEMFLEAIDKCLEEGL